MLTYVSILNILITSFLRQCVKHADLHKDLQQLSYGMVKVRSYGQYDVNGFRFRSIKFEAAHPLTTTTNTGVVTRVIDAE
jgi:hypothetical protein